MARETEQRTDRGFVVISDMDSGLKHIQVSMRLEGNGTARNVVAEHVGRADVVLDSPASFRRNGTSLVSTEPMEVYIDANDGRLHVTPVADWDRMGV